LKLKNFYIKNFRNLNETNILLHPEINFLVGENDFGKSNFLDLLDILFTRRSFCEEDFTNKFNSEDETIPIKVEFIISIDECEIGVFEDYFDSNNYKEITIIAEQKTPEDDIEFIHKETLLPISYTKFRALNFLKYNSSQSTETELNLYRNKRSGKFFNFLIDKFVGKINSNKLAENIKELRGIKRLVQYTNLNVKKLKFFKQFDINTGLETIVNDLFYRMIQIRSKDRDIQKSGDGIKYSFLIMLFLLEKIINIVSYKNNQDRICIEGDKKSISMILALDEPEIHLHPYMQRSLIKNIVSILKSQDNDFSSLIKHHFNLDGIKGQIIIVTHLTCSPNMLTVKT